MKKPNYGMMGKTSMNPRSFMIQALKKCSLNNKNIIKMIQEQDKYGIEKRTTNSIKILEEMDMTLNKDNTSNVIDRLQIQFEWLKQEFEAINHNWEEEPEKCIERTENTNPVINDLLEGFKGMSD